MKRCEPGSDLATTPGAWSWWTHPRALQVGPRVHLGVASSEDIAAVSVDLLTHAVERWPLGDSAGNDHTNPAVLSRPGKPAVVAYAGHAADPYVRVRRGLQSADVSLGPFGDEHKIEVPQNLATYAILHDQGDTIHLWFRCRAIYWGYARSDDWGLTWTRPTLVFQGDDKLYCAVRQTATGARVALTTHPHWSGTQDVLFAEVDYATGVISAAGRPVGMLNDDVLPIGRLEVAARPPLDRRTWVYDVSVDGTPMILWASMTREDMPGTGQYHVTWLDGCLWRTEDLASTGKPFLNGANFYAGGAQFVPGGLVLSRHDGSRWLVERHLGGPGAWRVDEVPVTSQGDPVRVWPVQGSDALLAVNVLRRYDGYASFDAAIAVVPVKTP